MPRKPAAGPSSPKPNTSDRAEHQKDVINGLRRIKGQARGLTEMIQANRSCEDVALQM
ncbi:MAG: metal-sensitive transcriptional regulator [Curvibacter sp.]|nr:metal-sensitive transcriptional regulator [Curvibacter sp.]